jgi:hypothetical protein
MEDSVKNLLDAEKDAKDIIKQAENVRATLMD